MSKNILLDFSTIPAPSTTKNRAYLNTKKSTPATTTTSNINYSTRSKSPMGGTQSSKPNSPVSASSSGVSSSTRFGGPIVTPSSNATAAVAVKLSPTPSICSVTSETSSWSSCSSSVVTRSLRCSDSNDTYCSSISIHSTDSNSNNSNCHCNKGGSTTSSYATTSTGSVASRAGSKRGFAISSSPSLRSYASLISLSSSTSPTSSSSKNDNHHDSTICRSSKRIKLDTTATQGHISDSSSSNCVFSISSSDNSLNGLVFFTIVNENLQYLF